MLTLSYILFISRYDFAMDYDSIFMLPIPKLELAMNKSTLPNIQSATTSAIL